MLVDLEELEPGSIVETPSLLKERGFAKADQIVYIGAFNSQPRFATKPAKDWVPIFWPVDTYPVSPPTKYNVIEDATTFADFAKDWINGLTFKLGDPYSSGCDPEFFVLDKLGQVVPARSVLPKKRTNVKAFYDGLQAEITPDAGGCLEGLCTRIRGLLMRTEDQFRLKDSGSKISIKNSVLLTPEQMAKLEDEDVRFRCSDSVNIYNDIPPLREPREYLWRFAGGHIHVGVGYNGVIATPVKKNMIRAMDAILGVAGVSLARNFDTPERRKSYGRAGECRWPSHGLEYRVLSNYWLCSPVIYHLTFEIARWAYRMGETGLFPKAYVGTEQEVRECINNCDVALAQKLIKKNATIYSKLFDQCWGIGTSRSTKLTKTAMNTIMNGLEVVVKDPTNIPGNWLFGSTEWGSYGGDLPNSKWRNLR